MEFLNMTEWDNVVAVSRELSKPIWKRTQAPSGPAGTEGPEGT